VQPGGLSLADKALPSIAGDGKDLHDQGGADLLHFFDATDRNFRLPSRDAVAIPLLVRSCVSGNKTGSRSDPNPETC